LYWSVPLLFCSSVRVGRTHTLKDKMNWNRCILVPIVSNISNAVPNLHYTLMSRDDRNLYYVPVGNIDFSVLTYCQYQFGFYFLMIRDLRKMRSRFHMHYRIFTNFRIFWIFSHFLHNSIEIWQKMFFYTFFTIIRLSSTKNYFPTLYHAL